MSSEAKKSVVGVRQTSNFAKMQIVSCLKKHFKITVLQKISDSSLRACLFVVRGKVVFFQSFVWFSTWFLWLLLTGGGNLFLFFSRNFVYREVPINCNFSGPAERVRLVACQLIGIYPARDYHH